MTIAFRKDEPRVTAADVKAAALPLTPWGRRGYNPDAVDELLDRVARELRMCANEATGLREEVMRLRRRFVTSQRGEPGEWLADASEAHAMAVAIVSEAQVTADRYVTDAQEYAGRLTGEAQERRENMLAEAERVLGDARTQARDAADAALDEPVPDRADGQLRAVRAAAAYQGTFNGVYLTHVSLLVDTLQQMLGDWKRKELGDGREPAVAGRSPAPRETATAREEH
jgi:DivIVA domain-containing protein